MVQNIMLLLELMHLITIQYKFHLLMKLLYMKMKLILEQIMVELNYSLDHTISNIQNSILHIKDS